MLKKLFTIVLLVLMVSVCVYSQDNTNGLSSGRAPFIKVQYPMSLLQYGPNYFYSRVFGYNAYGGSVALGPFKMWATGTGMTSLYTDPLSANFVQAGSFASDGYWYGARYSTNQLLKIDTSTGILTTVATITGITSLTGMAWDFTTNTMYGSDYGTSNKIGTLNLTTGVFTPLSGVVGTGLLIDIACSNSGQLYGHMITSTTTNSQIYSINKTTGVGTALSATTGFIANYAQGMTWDHSVDSGYLAAYNYGTSNGEWRKIDIATGATTLIATIVSEADGMAMPGGVGPQITHTPLPNTTNTTGPYVVNAVISPAGSGINSFWTKVFWSRNNTSITDSVQMTHPSGNNWTGSIPGNSTTATYRYYIRTGDSLGRFATSPTGAPGNLYLFTASSTDTTHNYFTHTPLGDCPRTVWPSTVSCTVTNSYGVDSVWVSWKKNTGALNRFNLAHGTGTTWSNPFNSDTTQVVVGDSIHYKIIARNLSGNKDSTVQYGFKIVMLSNICLGTGTVSSNFPFSTYWEDGRTDMLFLASEITGAGGYPCNITQIAFNVISVGGPMLNGFNVKFQNTAASTISAFTNSGWTVALNGTYTVSTAGWNVITLTTPYQWNGSGNLLMEVCYNNNAWSAYSPVNSTTGTGNCVAYSTDLPSGDGCTAAWTAATNARPNVCFTITPLVGVGNNTTIIPGTYALSQNYPNPFNPVTQIKFDLPKQGFTTLKVFDILGREVSRLVNEVKTPGSYIVDFDGTNLSSGVYFYKLEVNGFSDIKRMVLIK
jgi:hypothetical protein